ncbi:MAG TPA: hypothetical protein VGL56_09220 [Fimbriimonadaceae bacterium]|jgi:hypothetical protein
MTALYDDADLLKLVTRNCFRVFGVSTTATKATIQLVSGRISKELQLDMHSQGTFLPWLPSLMIDKVSLEESKASINLPSSRINARIWWFSGDSALKKFEPHPDETVLIGWVESLQKLSNHDALLLFLAGSSVLDPRFNNLSLWADCLRRWIELIHSDSFWYEQRIAEQRSGFEPRASDNDFARLRKATIDQLLLPVIEAGTDALVEERDEDALRIKILIEMVAPNEEIQLRYLAKLFLNLTATLSEACDDLHEKCWKVIVEDDDARARNLRALMPVIDDFETTVVPIVDRIRYLLGENALTRKNLNVAAKCVFEIAKATTWTDDSKLSSRLFHNAAIYGKGTVIEGKAKERLVRYGVLIG